MRISNSGTAAPNLRPLWDALLEIYRIIADICDRHELRYCADTGTTLGAVRHQGFIPWDDDMDLQMPRPDYEKFVEIAKKELPEGYAWLDRHVCPSYDNGFGKVIITDEAIVNRIARESGLVLGQGVFVDIFPLDGYPDSWVGQKWRKVQNLLVGFQSKLYRGWKSCVTRKGKISFCIGLLLYPFNYKIRNYREQVEFYEKRAKKYSFGSTKKCVSIGCAQYADDKPYAYAYFGKLKKIPFEHTEMQVQEKVEEYLTAMFGDYMQLPPIEKRYCVHSGASTQSWRLGPLG